MILLEAQLLHSQIYSQVFVHNRLFMHFFWQDLLQLEYVK